VTDSELIVDARILLKKYGLESDVIQFIDRVIENLEEKKKLNSNWFRVEDAPKSREHIIVWLHQGQSTVAYWDKKRSGWINIKTGDFVRFKFWQPINAPRRSAMAINDVK
jgi:hypothetical protein